MSCNFHQFCLLFVVDCWLSVDDAVVAVFLQYVCPGQPGVNSFICSFLSVHIVQQTAEWAVSMLICTGLQSLVPQVMLDHSSTSADSDDSPEQYKQADQQQQQPAAAELYGTHERMQDATLLAQQQDSADNTLQTRMSMQSPFGEVVPPTLLGSTDSQDADLATQQQQLRKEGSTTGRPLAGSTSAAAAGQMLPPTSSGSGRRASANSPPLPRSDSAGVGAAAAAGSSGSGRGTHMVGPVANQQGSSDGRPLDRPEASLSVGNILSSKAAISGAASLEGWLPASAIAAAVAAAVAESGSPRAAAAAAAALMRTSSTASTAGICRQGSLVFNPLAGQQQQRPSNLGNLAGRSATATLESQGSFAGWPAAAAAAAAERADTAAANNAADGGFSWPNMPISRSLSEAQAALSAAQAALRREDSLKLDIQVQYCNINWSNFSIQGEGDSIALFLSTGASCISLRLLHHYLPAGLAFITLYCRDKYCPKPCLAVNLTYP